MSDQTGATIEWREIDKEIKAVVVDGHRETIATWCPQPGSQEVFLQCPVFEVLYEGTRGPGKTDALLMDFAQHVGMGFGKDWVGLLFRRTFPELSDVIRKSKIWFPLLFPDAKYNESKSTWTFSGGEQLLFSYIQREEDYYRYHGHAYPWIAFEELTTWPDDKLYRRMMSCSRSTKPGMPRKYRSTTNPYGVGHNWVKTRFKLPNPRGRMVGRLIVTPDKPNRIAIHGNLMENKILLHADPDYVGKLREAARNPAELAAWLEGSWDITSGGMFDDLWRNGVHVIENIPFKAIPRSWRIDRSYDHGQSRPFSVGWWAESNGEPIVINGKMYGSMPGDLFRIAEWYGWSGSENEGVRLLSSEIARGIIDREQDWGLLGRVKPGPADSSIFDDFEPGKSVAADMRNEGVRWDPADKGPGSRKQGWEQMRNLFKGALPQPHGPREDRGLFICERCPQFIRTVPGLPRSDKDPDDVDTEAEDHIGDEARYRIRHKRRAMKSGRF